MGPPRIQNSSTSSSRSARQPRRKQQLRSAPKRLRSAPTEIGAPPQGVSPDGGGSPEPNREKVGQVNQAQLRKIAEIKMEDLNANDLDAGARMIAGTARSMGIEVVD